MELDYTAALWSWLNTLSGLEVGAYKGTRAVFSERLPDDYEHGGLCLLVSAPAALEVIEQSSKFAQYVEIRIFGYSPLVVENSPAVGDLVRSMQTIAIALRQRSPRHPGMKTKGIEVTGPQEAPTSSPSLAARVIIVRWRLEEE